MNNIDWRGATRGLVQDLISPPAAALQNAPPYAHIAALLGLSADSALLDHSYMTVAWAGPNPAYLDRADRPGTLRLPLRDTVVLRLNTNALAVLCAAQWLTAEGDAPTPRLRAALNGLCPIGREITLRIERV